MAGNLVPSLTSKEQECLLKVLTSLEWLGTSDGVERGVKILDRIGLRASGARRTTENSADIQDSSSDKIVGDLVG